MFLSIPTVVSVTDMGLIYKIRCSGSKFDFPNAIYDSGRYKIPLAIDSIEETADVSTRNKWYTEILGTR